MTEEKIKRIKNVEKILEEIYERDIKKDKTDLKSKYYDDNGRNKKKILTIKDLMYSMMFHAQNGTGRLGIKLEYNCLEDEKVLNEVLCGYVPKDICTTYKTYEDLKEKILNKEEFFRKKGRNKMQWGKYIETVYYIAKFLKEFDNVEEVMLLFDIIYKKIPYCLPKCIQIIPGFGSAFSADFLKEICYDSIEFSNFIKPDVHLKEFMKEVFNVEKEMPLYYACQEIAKKLEWSVYKFDKIIYLYCSRNFYNEEDKKTEYMKKNKNNPNKNNERREQLIKYINGICSELKKD